MRHTKNGHALGVCLLVACAACGASKPSAGPAAAPSAAAPSNPAAVDRMVRGAQAAKDGQRDAAVALLGEAVRIDPSLWEARYDLGVVLAGAGDLARAEEELALAAKTAPDAQDVAVALAEVRRRRGEHKLAADALAGFVHDHPAAVDARTLYVAALRESGQVDKAIAEAREVLVRKPADATALAELSLSHLAKGEKQAAALLAKQALDASPTSAVAHRATGLIDLGNGDDAAAFSEFRKAAQADPHDTTSRTNMAVVLLRAGAYAKAEDQYREILRVAPDDADAQVGLAAALRGQADAQHPQRLDEARALLDRVLAADAHDIDALFNLGVLYADFLKKPAQAAPLFKRFLDDAPGDHPLRSKAEKYASATATSAGAVQPTAAPAPSGPAGPAGAESKSTSTPTSTSTLPPAPRAPAAPPKPARR